MKEVGQHESRKRKARDLHRSGEQSISQHALSDSQSGSDGKF